MSKSRYNGMTLNERLFEAGLLASFDDALAAGDRHTLETMLGSVNAEPGLAKTLLGEGFACWFCGQEIERTKSRALTITLQDLWTENAESEPTQIIYAHFECAGTRMKGASMNLERDVLFPDEYRQIDPDCPDNE